MTMQIKRHLSLQDQVFPRFSAFVFSAWLSAGLMITAGTGVCAQAPVTIVRSNDATQSENEARPLAPGQPVARAIAWGEVHAWQITLAAGQYLRVVVEQHHSDLIAALSGPDGQQLIEGDSHWHGPEPVSWIATTAGDYRLTVRLRERLTIPTRYEIRIEAPRSGTLADEKRIAAERASSMGKKLLLQEMAESRPQAIKRYEDALALWRDLDDRAEEAQTLHSLGYLRHKMNQPREALECYEQALAIRQSISNVVGEAQTLHNIAAVHVSLKEKMKYYELALERRRAAGDRRGEAQTLGNLCGFSLSPPKAIECFNQALGLAREAGDLQAEALTLNGLGTINRMIGRTQEAINYFLRALAALRLAGDRQGETAALNNLGVIHSDLGETRQALEYFEQALPLLRSLGDRRTEAVVLNNLGTLSSLVGEARKALEYYHQALSLARASNDPRSAAHMLNNLGQIYAEVGEKQKALESLNEALSLSRQHSLRELEATILNNFGTLHGGLGEPQTALDYLTQARQIFHAIGDRRKEAFALSNAGVCHTDLGKVRESLGYFQQALSYWRDAGDQRGEAYTLNHLGLAHHLLNEDRQALDCYQQALRLSQAVGDRQGEAYALSNLGGAWSTLGEKLKAREAHRQALSLWQALLNRQWEAVTLSNLAAVDRDLGDLDAARAHLETALDLIEALRTKVASQELRASYFASTQGSYQLCIDLLMQLNKQRPGEGFAAMAFDTSERARARSLLELLTEAQPGIRQGIDPALKEREQANQIRLSWLNTQLIREQMQQSPEQKKKIATLTAELQQAESERRQLEAEIRRSNPKYAETLYPKPLRLEAIQALLDDQTSLLEYALGDDESFLFVVSREGIQTYRLPGVAEIERRVEKLRTALVQSGRLDFGDYVQSARRLYELLIAPASPALARKRHLLIVPAGKLSGLPFEALLTAEARTGGQADYRSLAYLLRRWRVSYAPSASVLASLRQNQQRAAQQRAGGAAMQFVAFADPVSEEQFPPLIHSSREVRHIAQLFQPQETRVYQRQAAREENVKNNEYLSRARYLHFSLHGEINEAKPHNSALVLTPGASTQEDGRLRVYEIFNLKLNAELVVLSACRTGLGKELKGEGVIGLTRAFMYAGASSVAVTLWQVADPSTAELMIRFYQQLNRGADKAEALRRAKLELIEAGRYARPYYWAPFVLTGEPE
jgi:CHAT domain-containing protein/Tfp pilus assembly protein PilF